MPMDAVDADGHAVGVDRPRELGGHGFALVVVAAFLEIEHGVRLPRQVHRQHQLVQAVGVVPIHVQGRQTGAFERRDFRRSDPDPPGAGGCRRPAVRKRAGFEPVEERQPYPRRFVVQQDDLGRLRRRDVAGRGREQQQVDRFIALFVRIVQQRNGHGPAAFAGSEREPFLDGLVVRARLGRSIARREQDLGNDVGQADALDRHLRDRRGFLGGESGRGKAEHGVGDEVARQRNVVDVPTAEDDAAVGRAQAPADIDGRFAVREGGEVQIHVRPSPIDDRAAGMAPGVDPAGPVARNLHDRLVVGAVFDAQPARELEPDVVELGAIDGRRRQIEGRGNVVRVIPGQIVAVDVRAGEARRRIGKGGASAKGPSESPLPLDGPAGIRVERFEQRRVVVPDAHGETGSRNDAGANGVRQE